MNASDQLDFVLGLVEDDHLAGCERELAGDPPLADRVARLKSVITALVDDGEVFEPPPDLVRRTLARVAEQRRRPVRRSALDLIPARLPFRWADVAVAAGIFLAALATLLPAVRKSRGQADQLACAWNLQQLGTSLNQFAAVNGTYPYADPNQDGGAPYAGAFAVLLKEQGLLRDPKLLRCPHVNGQAHDPCPIPDYEALCAQEREAPRSAPCLRDIDYAYNLGVHRDGRPGPIIVNQPGLDSVPLLADRPAFSGPHTILPGNSPNHCGAGQNVLFAGGHVRFHPNRRVGPDEDIYLNADQRLAPGAHLFDAVLAPGIVRFDGH